MNPIFAKAEAALKQRGFEVQCFETGAQAAQSFLASLTPGHAVGIGGSMTIKDLGIADKLRAQEHPVFWHWEVEPKARPGVYAQALAADHYLCSANALTQDGRIVQIDGTGNRVGALCTGPQKATLIVGSNKLVTGGLLAAQTRVKQTACPLNARRLGLNTPCAKTGICDEDNCHEHCMCHGMLILDRPFNGHSLTVLLVAEALGY